MRAIWQHAQLWFWGKFFIVLIAIGCGTRRRRMSHNQGVAGRGKLKIVDRPQFPPTDFFEPGREFPCRLRHGCVSFLDDAVSEVRSASLKFADSDFRSPLDIQMNTGEHCFFWTARTFLQFAFWRHRKGTTQYVKYYRRYPWGRRSAASAFRRAPASYATMHYHSHTPFGWHARDGKMRYVRFRLVRGDGEPELDAPDQAYVEQCEQDVDAAERLGQQACLPQDEHLSVNYLQHQWHGQLRQEPIHYRLQIQLHEVTPSDSPEILNSLLPWDQQSHPFQDLADVSIVEPLSYAQQQYIAFEVTNLPRSMSILPAKSIDDYNSLNYMRKQSIWAIRMRRFFQRMLGPAKAAADDAPHGISPKGM